MRNQIDGFVFDRGARGNRAEIVVVFPIYARTHRSRREASAAIGANVTEHIVHTLGAKRALETADARVGRGRR